MQLRPHQQKNFEELRIEVRAGRDPLLVAECGYGKGTIISEIVKSAVAKGNEVIFAVHGKSLVEDMHQRVKKLGIPHGVLMGDHRRERWHKVQVASIDTLHRMAHPPRARLFIIDEAHMALSPTWRKVIERYPNTRLIGATATPYRLGREGFSKGGGGLFDSMILGPPAQDLIDMGHLVRSRVLAPPAPSDLGSVKKTAGEFNAKQLAEVCDKTKLIGDIVEHWKRHASDKKTVAFAVDKSHAQHITNQFNESGVPWAYVDADTPMGDSDNPQPGTRAYIYRDLDRRDRTLMGVASVGCVSTGWDHAIVSCLVAARPTASMGLWRQMLGRGSRPYRDKDHFLVLDHSSNTHRHAPYGMFESEVPWSLDGEIKIPSDLERAQSIATCRFCFATFARGPENCPFCGKQLLKNQRKVEVVAGELKEIVNMIRQPSPAEEPAVEKFLQFLRRGRQLSKNGSYAPYRYRMETGQVPTKVIMEAAKRRLSEEESHETR